MRIVAVLALFFAGANIAARSAAPPAEAWRADRFDPREYFSAAEIAKWRESSKPYRTVYFAKLAVELAFYLALLFTPLGALLWRGAGRFAGWLAGRWPFRTDFADRLGAVPARVFGDDWTTAFLFAYALFAGGVLLELPFSLWIEALNQRAGVSNYGTITWIVDLLIGTAIQITLYSFLVFGLYGLIRRLPRRWWIALTVPAGLVMIGYGFVEPYTARFFYTLTPLEQTKHPKRRELQRRLERLAKKEGVSLAAIKVINTSRTTKKMNAYISGLGGSRELVLYDNLLDRANLDEIEVAVAHELGHVRRRNLLLTYSTAALALALLLLLIAFLLRWGSAHLGFDGPGDVRNLPVLALTLMLVFNALTPIMGCRERQEERLADRVSLTLTQNPDAFISLQVKLTRINKNEIDPPRWVVIWFDSHPSTYERIGTARWYKRWLKKRRAGGSATNPRR